MSKDMHLTSGSGYSNGPYCLCLSVNPSNNNPERNMGRSVVLGPSPSVVLCGVLGTSVMVVGDLTYHSVSV